MQILQESRKVLDYFGFSPKMELFNRQTLRILVITFPGVILMWIYTFHVADSAQKLIESIFMVIVSTCVLLSFATMIPIRGKIFSLIESVGEFSGDDHRCNEPNREQSELQNLKRKKPTPKEILEKTNEFVEKYSRIGLFVLKYGFAPCVIFPKAFISFYIYLMTDLGNDAFDLPVPMW